MIIQNSDKYIFIKFDTLITEEEFVNFLRLWKDLYSLKNKFIFIFDTRNIKYSNTLLKYSIQMTKFIKELKKESIQYLQRSIILLDKKYISYLLDFMFEIEKPVADIYLWTTKTHNHQNIMLISKNILNVKSKNIIKIQS